MRGKAKGKINMQLSIIKIGGNIIDDEAKLAAFLEAFAAVPEKRYWCMAAVSWPPKSRRDWA